MCHLYIHLECVEFTNFISIDIDQHSYTLLILLDINTNMEDKKKPLECNREGTSVCT